MKDRQPGVLVQQVVKQELMCWGQIYDIWTAGQGVTQLNAFELIRFL